MALKERFQRYVEQQDLPLSQSRILVAVSGGVDSMVLFSLMQSCGYRIGVAHCNFQLRGEESMEDEAMVRCRVEQLGLPFYNQRFDTLQEMERTGESMEMAARRLRYLWFEELCQAHGYDLIAIAHHADDSVETFFINLLRGTGLRGLTGIHTRNGRLIRPLMFASRREILEYALQEKIPFREDSSNRSTKHLRNKIRLGLVPRIREINPKFTLQMQRNISRLTDAQRFVDAAIAAIRQEVVEEQGELSTIYVDRIHEGFPHHFVIYELLNSAYGFKGDVIDSLCHALDAGASGRRFYAPRHVAYIDRGRIQVAPIAEGDPCEVKIEREMMRAYCGNSVLYFEHCDIDTIKEFGVPPQMAQLDADRLEFPLTLRRWREGDWFVPFGMTGRRKVSDFLIDQKVSMAEKERQFVLLSGGEIVWVVGRRIDDRYRLVRTTENVLRITQEIL
uniref:tRNA lysidine(34) synthetase TilS n=1 Tax=Alistipes sp. TaxID=1872444 RepID=UPI004055C492